MNKLVPLVISSLIFTHLFTIGGTAERGESNLTSPPANKPANVVVPETESPNPSSSSIVRKKEYAKRVSLVPVHTKTDYEANRESILSSFNPAYRRIICQAVFDVYRMRANAKLHNYVFETHLYEFELESGETSVSVGIHCPSKGFPEVFLRVPMEIDKDIQVVFVRGDYIPEKRFFRFESVNSIRRVTVENETTAQLRENPIFGVNLEERWSLCEKARALFKYELRDQHMTAGEDAIYEVKTGEETRLYATIECPFDPFVYLCFCHSTPEVKIIFLNGIQERIEDEELSLKSDLMRALLNLEVREEPYSPDAPSNSPDSPAKSPGSPSRSSGSLFNQLWRLFPFLQKYVKRSAPSSSHQ